MRSIDQNSIELTRQIHMNGQKTRAAQTVGPSVISNYNETIHSFFIIIVE